MGKTIISVNNLSKRYRIGVAENGYKTFREAIMDGVMAPVRNLARLRSLTRFKNGEEKDVIWALKDVSFEVREGEVLGIIGRNGAGKSTLLRILSRITEPTSGSVDIYGRVSSLLEVGTGFHPELTGRENIFLNGAILGMRKQEIERKFAEIVAFAEIEKFLDTPVKRYSSGMYVRLAFAVAAHLEPEILLVDEVLAVGDAAFQKKCLGKMGEVARGGRTVLFVSHNMPSIQALCNRVLLLESGQLTMSDNPDLVVPHYLSQGVASDSAEADLSHHRYRSQSQEPVLRKVWLLNHEGIKTNSIMMDKALSICFEFRCSRPIANPGFGFGIEDEHGRRIFSLNNYMMPTPQTTFNHLQAGIAICRIPSINLMPGKYFVSVSIVEAEHEIVDYVERAIMFHVQEVDIYGSGRIPHRLHGVFFVRGEITIESQDTVDELFHANSIQREAKFFISDGGSKK